VKHQIRIGFINERTSCPARLRTGFYEIACWLSNDDRVTAIGEFKTFWNLDTMPDNASDIIDRCTNRDTPQVVEDNSSTVWLYD